jgi:hypothetical protein
MSINMSMNTSNDETKETNNIEGSYYDYIFIIFIIIGVILIIYAVKIHVDIYDSLYVPIRAIISNVSCQRYIINRYRDQYHCLIDLEYQINERLISNDIQTYGSTTSYHVGDAILIYVNKDNPMDIYVPYMTHTFLSLLLGTIGVLLILISIGVQYLHIYDEEYDVYYLRESI